MLQITIIEELNLGTAVRVSATTSSCLASLWVFQGDWDNFMEYGGGEWRNNAIKLIGPVSPQIVTDLSSSVSTLFVQLGYKVLTEITADD